jgi:hypothetical protein
MRAERGSSNSTRAHDVLTYALCGPTPGGFIALAPVFHSCLEAPMSQRFLSRFSKAHGLLVAALVYAASAGATCSDTRIKQMAQNGETIAAIANSCEMDKDDVRKILNDEASSGEASKSIGADTDLLPPGTPVEQCGCWGPFNLAVRQPHPRCQSGYTQPKVCGGVLCTFDGNYEWQRVCSE